MEATQDNKPKMMLISLTDGEIAAARQMFEIALKAGGRSVVQAFAVLDAKFAQAIPAPKPTPAPAKNGESEAPKEHPRNKSR